MTTEAPPTTESRSGFDRYFEITRPRFDRRPGGPRRPRHLLHDGLHRGAQPADPGQRGRRRRRQPADRRARRRHRAGRRRDDDPHGRGRPLPARAGRRARRQRPRGVRDRAADDLGRRDGPRGDRGRAHRDPGAHRPAYRRLPLGAHAAQDRDRGRHRPVPDDHRSGRRRLRAAAARRRRHDGPGRPRHRRQAGELAGAGVRARPAVHADPVRAQDEGRDPDRHPGHDALRDHRRGDRQRRTVLRERSAQPARLEPQRPAAGRAIRSTCPTSRCSASSTCSARGRPPARWSRSCSCSR